MQGAVSVEYSRRPVRRLVLFSIQASCQDVTRSALLIRWRAETTARMPRRMPCAGVWEVAGLPRDLITVRTDRNPEAQASMGQGKLEGGTA